MGTRTRHQEGHPPRWSDALCCRERLKRPDCLRTLRRFPPEPAILLPWVAYNKLIIPSQIGGSAARARGSTVYRSQCRAQPAAVQASLRKRLTPAPADEKKATRADGSSLPCPVACSVARNRGRAPARSFTYGSGGSVIRGRTIPQAGQANFAGGARTPSHVFASRRATTWNRGRGLWRRRLGRGYGTTTARARTDEEHVFSPVIRAGSRPIRRRYPRLLSRSLRATLVGNSRRSLTLIMPWLRQRFDPGLLRPALCLVPRESATLPPD